MEPTADFWKERYATGDTRWDLGMVSTPLKAYFDQLTNKDLRILIPGGGRSYEAEYLHRSGFRNVFVLDLADAPLADLVRRCPDFPREHLIVGDFFHHQGQYDRIIEQTFFCALHPRFRTSYVDRMHELLVPGGMLTGVLFDDPMDTDHPPYGGDAGEYRQVFGHKFEELTLAPCHNSVEPRAGREVWLRAVKRT
ncbi:MAG: SAM-dependent methyltransferase [Flavobacteriales bacterium]|jgi:hypothetical protein|nr:SAM-dependent methyltransferase [Flavobacteriales bacterium]MBK6893947.1 SAM-dependent methyltransferase [Flavobacteriales bacterium]MBK7247891.1 SAM-dependent methyltransferase [Flavobacteriales bacterium]QQS73160.1 MAG: SAM-dependent methyltransferase [Flavobacteriales bacterium]HQV39367.1 SAM-dependent methyltransferase [Flavobacteriales bacterium]